MVTSRPKSGLKSGMEPSDLDFLTIGCILSTWGVKGKLKVQPESDFPGRFTPGLRVYIDRQPAVIRSTEWHQGKLLIQLDTIDRPEDARKLRGKAIKIPYSQVHPLPEGQYYHFQLIGLEVWTTQGELLGKITEILTAESNDNYVVRSPKGEILIPAITDVVKSIDLEQGRLTVEAIAGLVDLNRKND